MAEESKYKIGDTYWYVDYGTGGKLKVYCIKICSGQDFGKGLAQFDTQGEAMSHLIKMTKYSNRK